MPYQQERIGDADMVIPDYQFFEVRPSKRKDRQERAIINIVLATFGAHVFLILFNLVELVTDKSGYAPIGFAMCFVLIPGLHKTLGIMAKLRDHGF